MTNIIAIVPARRGSVRLPDKNCKTFMEMQGRGFSLVDMALAFTNEIPVSAVLLATDYFSGSFYMEGKDRLRGKPFMFVERPSELCGPSVPMADVVSHALDTYLADRGAYPDAFLLLQPTSPIRDSTVILQAINLYEAGTAKAICSVTPSYKPNGNFYLLDTIKFKETKNFFPEGVYPIVQDWPYCIDIDTEEDFHLAQFMMAHMNKRW